MKTLTFRLLLMAIAVIMMACGGQQNRNTDNDSTLMDADSVGNTAVMQDNNAGGVADKDEDFIEEATSGGLMEVELGRYAQQNAQNPRVRNFGAMMVRDHSQVNEELKAILTQKNLTVPTQMEDNHRNRMNNIQKKTGADFDKEYMGEMVDDHEKDVDRFKRYAENGNDPELKAFAAKTLPVLLMHQDSAKNIRDAIK